MKFRTEIVIRPDGFRVDYDSRILSLGSCFADTVAAHLAAAKFRIAANPTGILFNPASIAAALHGFAGGAQLDPETLREGTEGWFHFDFHSAFNRPTRGAALDAMNAALRSGAEALAAADRVIVTFGTARVYEHDGRVVANCHKQPAGEFRCRMLDVGEIVDEWSELLRGALRGKQVLFTVSPVRHAGDGLETNSLSKALLRVAVARLVELHPHARYFPAYEILLDDLRDYRFYADDLVHPSPAAVAYVRERFEAYAFDAATRERAARVREVVAAAAHRPLHPGSEAHRAFCRRQLEAIAALPDVDLRAEERHFRQASDPSCPIG